MATRATENDKRSTNSRGSQESAAARYVSDLKAKYGAHVMRADESRRIIDESMREASLTALLYKSKEDSGA